MDSKSQHFWIVPVHINQNHWTIATIDFRNKSIRYFDSLEGVNRQILDALEMWLGKKCLAKRWTTFDKLEFIKEHVSDFLKQENSTNFIAKNNQISFSQEHILYIKKKMILQIVEGKLVP